MSSIADIDPEPSDAVTPARLRVLLLVCRLHAEGRRPTVRLVARLLGTNVNAAYASLLLLRRDGLVSWEAGRCATLVPTVRVEVVR